MNVLISFPFSMVEDTIKTFENINDVYITENFAQVLAMCKNGQVERVCIIGLVGNYTGPGFCVAGQIAAERIHAESGCENIPILIWCGRERNYESKKSSETYLPIKNPNTEFYYGLGAEQREEEKILNSFEFIDLVSEFLSGSEWQKLPYA